MDAKLIQVRTEGGRTDKPNFRQYTHAALLRFVEAVDTVMEANDLDARERVKLINHWAYQCTRPDMPEQLAAAILRCQSDPDDALVTATSKVDPITGAVVAYNPGD